MYNTDVLLAALNRTPFIETRKSYRNHMTRLLQLGYVKDGSMRILADILLQYQISTDGTVTELSLKTAVPTYLCRKTGRVMCRLLTSYGETIKLSVARLVLMRYRPLDAHWKYRYANVKHIDGNLAHTDLSNLEWIFRDYTPSGVPGVNCPIDTLFPIPGFSDYRIDGHARVWSEKTQQFLSTGYSKDNDVTSYLVIRLIDDDGASKLMRLHRLMALTFLTHPVNCDDLHVNHKDGVRTNNVIGNLEWSTPGDNINHAITIGLRETIPPRERVIYVMHEKTGEIHTCVGLADLHAYTGIPKTTLSAWLDDAREMKFRRGISVKYADSIKSWPVTASKCNREKREGLPIIVKDISTGTVSRYAFVNDFHRLVGGSRYAIIRKARTGDKSPYLGRYIVVEDNGEDIEWPEYTELQLFLFSIGRVGIDKVVRRHDTVTGAIDFYPSNAAAAHNTYVSDYRIREALKSGAPINGRYKFDEISPAAA